MATRKLPLNLRSNKQMRQVLGVSEKYFNMILPHFSAIYSEFLADSYYNNPKRQRSFGGGRKSRLKTDSDKLAFCLYYLKSYPTFAVLANRFDMSASTAHDNFKLYMPFLRHALVSLGVEPIREFKNDADLSAYLKKRY
jgi:hypothetical protein